MESHPAATMAAARAVVTLGSATTFDMLVTIILIIVLAITRHCSEAVPDAGSKH